MSDTSQTRDIQFSVIIPNWNGKHHLEECLDSLCKQAFDNFETVLVDNGSNDGSVEFVCSKFPKVRIVALTENIGFAAGVNRGIEAAHGDYIVLLNNDTEVEQHWLESLALAMRANSDVWIFASKLLNYYDRKIIDSAGDALDLSLGPYKLGEFNLSEICRERCFIFGACGGGGCYKRELFDRIGLLDEDFFAYFEDVDLSFRANWAGFRCLSVPDAVIYHKVAATSGTSTSSKDRFDIMRRRNYLFLIIKNYPFTLLVQHGPFICAAHFLKFILDLCRGRFRVAFMTQWEIAKGLPKMLKKRQAIMAGRRISNTEMKSRCVPKYGGWLGFLRKKLGLGIGS
jgi:GT2 family glycosyltransferase